MNKGKGAETKRISIYIYPSQLEKINEICRRRKKSRRMAFLEAFQSYIASYEKGNIMSEEYERRQARASTHFKFFSEKYIFGSTRSELEPDERAVWLDFLCLASFNLGKVECFSRDQMAAQLVIERELLDRSIDKFIEFGKIRRENPEEEKKEVYSIVNWNKYQADYLTKRIKKFTSGEEIQRGGEGMISAADMLPILDKIKQDKTKEDNKTLNNTKADNTRTPESEYSVENLFSSLPDQLRGSSSDRDRVGSSRDRALLDELLLMLRKFSEYPFDEYKDTNYLGWVMEEYPGIDFVAELEKKLKWWEDHPKALKNGKIAHAQLTDWFKKAYTYKNRSRSLEQTQE